MPKASLYNAQGQAIGEVELSDRLFGAQGRASVVHRTVVAQLAHLRQGTHDTKTRGEVRGVDANRGAKSTQGVPAKAQSAPRTGARAGLCMVPPRATTTPS